MKNTRRTVSRLLRSVVALVFVLTLVVSVLPATAFAVVPEFTIWVAGQLLTSKNLTVAGDSGIASYDPVTKTLYLDNFHYNGEGAYESSDLRTGYASIYTEEAITLQFKGTNMVGNTAANGIGICAKAPLTIRGADEQIMNHYLSCSGGQYALQNTDNVTTIEYANFHAAGVYTRGLNASNSYLNFINTGTSVDGLYAVDAVTLTDCTVNAVGARNGLTVATNVNLSLVNTKLNCTGADGLSVAKVNMSRDSVLTATGTQGNAFKRISGVIGDVEVYAGAKESSAVPVAAPNLETYTGNPYVKLVAMHAHPVCGAVHTSIGDHTACTSQTWSTWSATDALPTESGRYCLSGDVTLTAPWIMEDQDIQLCLNGKTIDLNGHYLGNEEGSGKLTITDCKGTGTITGGKSRAALHFGTEAGPTLNLYGGTLTGNQAINGGGVYMNSGTFNMYGGTITGNQASYGGGLMADRTSVINLYGGTISGNTANKGDSIYVDNSYGKFYLYPGASISSSGCDFYICASSTITVCGELKNTTPMTVQYATRPVGNVVFAKPDGVNIEHLFHSATAFFTAFDPEYMVLSDAGELVLHKHYLKYQAADNVLTQYCDCAGHIETATVNPPVGTVVYDGTPKEGATVTCSAGWIGNAPTVSYRNNVEAGTATASISAGYATASVTFPIAPTAAAVEAPAPGNTITYGQDLAQVTLTNGWSWVDDTVIPTVKNNGYPAYYTPADTQNYDWTSVEGWNAAAGRVERMVPVTVEKAPLTLKPQEQTVAYGEAFREPGVTGTGFVNGDTAQALDGAASFACDYLPGDPVGAYTVTLSGLTSDNYSITFEAGNLNVTPKELTLTWGSSTFTYDGTAKLPEVTLSGVVAPDAVSPVVTGAQTNASATPYTATVTGLTGADAANYKLPANASRNFTIAKAQQAAPTPGKTDETVSGKADGTITDVSSAMEYRAEGENTYTAITGDKISGLADGSYYVRAKADENHEASADVKVTIAPGRLLTVTYKADDKTVDTVEVEYGKNATAPQIPAKSGYSAAWDHNGKNITADTVITAVYTKITTPPTGDSFNPGLWLTLMAASAAAAAALLVHRKRKAI